MDSMMATLGGVAILLLAGGASGLLSRRRFSLRWLLVAVALAVVNDAMLTNGYGVIPDLLPQSDWNWQGKVLALAATLIIASLPAFPKPVPKKPLTRHWCVFAVPLLFQRSRKHRGLNILRSDYR